MDLRKPDVLAVALRPAIPWPHTGYGGAASFRRAVERFITRMAPWRTDGENGTATEAWRATPPPDQVSGSERRDAQTAKFQELLVPHLDAAYNLARFLSRDADAAQDIVQEAYLRAFRAFDGYRGGEPRAWILAIVRNCYRAWAGRRQKDRANLAEPVAQDDLGWGLGSTVLEEIADMDHETPEGALARQSEVDAVRLIIEGLPEPFREVLILRELEEFGYRQIADIIEAPIGTVMSRLARARRLFGAAWLRHAGETETTK